MSDVVTLMAFWALMIVMFIMLFIMPQQRQRREREKFLSSLKAGDDIATSGGLCGRILNVDGEMATIRIADGVDIRVLKFGIQRRLSKEESAKLKFILKKGGS